jgi:hypothetical protein
MIKIIVTPAVLAALKVAFPKPHNAAQRALDKYVAVLEQMIDEALRRGQTEEQRKFKLYAISLHVLANRGGQIGPNKVRLHSWLKKAGVPLVEQVVKGSKFTQELSQVRFSSFAQLQTTSALSVKSVQAVDSEEAFDALVSGDAAAQQALFERLYPEFKSAWREDHLRALFDMVPVDTKSLQAFIRWLAFEATKFSKGQRERLIQDAAIICAVGKFNQGYFVQRKNPSAFGRMYYEGLSVQSAHKELRRAMLGDCWEYDMRSSVVAWKMGFAHAYVKECEPTGEVETTFRKTLLYLEDKKDFLVTLRRYTFDKNSASEPEFQLGLLKQALTAISFGARSHGSGWLEAPGKWRNPALVEILRNTNERKRFLADPIVQGFVAEQRALDGFICAQALKVKPELQQLKILQTPSGRLSQAKLLAYLYQHDETAVMNTVRKVAARHGREAIANVHDAIFFKQRLGSDLKSLIEAQLREETSNPYWHLTPTQLERYKAKPLDQDRLEAEHRARMQAEVAAAKRWVTSMFTQ